MKLVIKTTLFACVFSNPFEAMQKHQIPSTEIYESLQTKTVFPPYYLSLPHKRVV